VGTPIYEHEGKTIELAQIEPFMPAVSPVKTQELKENVKFRTYKLDNIIGLNIDGRVRYVASKA
jgi:hypothetical protein